jgi:hypothetical protein
MKLLLPIFLCLLFLLPAPAALVNLARSGTAAASSDGYGSIASDGNDGNRNGTFSVGSVFHTLNETGPSWWQVTLPAGSVLDHVRIFNRSDAVQGSVGNFRIVAQRGGVEVFNQVFLAAAATDMGNAKAWGTSALRGVQADLLRLERVSNAAPAVNFLTFAELEVWGTAGVREPLITPVSIAASPAGSGTAAGDAHDGDIHGALGAAGSPVYRSAAAGIGQFWEADLGTDMRVASILLFNRIDGADTSNVRVRLVDGAGTTVWSQTVTMAVGSVTPFRYGAEVEPNLVGRKVRVETIAGEFLSLAEVQTFGTPLAILPPVVANAEPVGIGATGATAGAVLETAGFAPTRLRLYHGPADGGSDPAAWAASADLGVQTGPGIYPFVLSGLPVATPYFYRAYAENEAGSDWADASVRLVTLEVSRAAVLLQPAFGVTGHTALLNGMVTFTGNDAPVVRLHWGTVDGGDDAAAWERVVDMGVQTGVFGHYLNSLQPGTRYFCRVSAVNAGGTSWSGATQSFETSQRPAVVINEVHYEPADETRNTEFVELWNPAAVPFSLAGWRLSGPVNYTFPAGVMLPPGGYVVVAGNAAAFQTAYGFAPAGAWTGMLRNRGDRIVLTDAAGGPVDDADYAPGFPWPTAAAGAGPSMELIHPALENDAGGAWRSSQAMPRQQTPGAANSVFAVAAPPAVSRVEHTPVTPAAGQEVVISAKLEDRNGVASARVLYQVVNPGVYIRKADAAYENGWIALALNDAGTEGDGLAGDGIWSVRIPGSVQVHRRLIRYRIEAADTIGGSVRVPYADDEQPNFAYFCYNGIPAWSGATTPGGTGLRGVVNSYSPELLGSIPPWHLIANGTDVINCQYNSSSDGQRFSGTMVYDGKVYDHMQFKNRGIGSTYVSGKNKWAFYFNRARNIRVKDNWGRYYDQTWNSMSMDAAASPWCAVHRGMAGVEEVISYRIYELCGVPALRTHFVHWRVIDAAAENGANQYDSDFWGLYTGMEPYEGAFLDERNLPDGNIYSIEGYGADKKHQSESQVTDNSDWTAFAAGTTQSGQTEAWYRANLDIPAYCTFQALNRYVANVDIRGGDNYRAYHRPAPPLGDNRWMIMPYDQDMMFLPAHHWAATLDGTVWPGVSNQWLAVTRRPAIAVEFRNRCRELLDLLASDPAPNGGQMAQLIDEYGQMVNPAGQALTWADADAALWNMHPRTAGTAGTASGYTNHKSNFFRATFADERGAPMGVVTRWTRRLPDPDGDGFGDFEGLMSYLTSFSTNAWPGGNWVRSNGRPEGYGYKFLEWESLYGGLGLNPTTPDLSFPARPVIAYAGAAGYPASGLEFTSSAFVPASNGTVFGGMQWRIGAVAAPGVPGYVAGEPRRYEIEDVWTSGVLPVFLASVKVPVTAVRPGWTYRARVRHRDANGRWSRWSEPVQFTAGVPDVSLFQRSLVISEVNYHPAPVTAAEAAAGILDSGQFEWIELRNVSGAAVPMDGLRFTKGIDFDFPAGWVIPAGGFALVVKDAAAFRQRWGSGLDGILAGTFASGSLSNAGEELKLSYGAGTEVIGFTYGDQAPWPEAADGLGATMVLRAPAALPDHAVPENWRASARPGGSPGADDLISYATWAAEYPGLGGPGADDDGDGYVNRLEYAFGGHPQQPGVPRLPEADVLAQGQDRFLALTLVRRADAEDLQYLPEMSVDLAEWKPLDVLVSRTLHADGTATEVWRSSAAVAGEARIFGRVRIP